jgi:hypothetical protein
MSSASVSRLRRWFPLWLVLAGFVLVAPLLAQDPQPSFENGTHALRRILHDNGFRQALRDWNELDDPARSLVVLLGDPPGRKMEELLQQIPEGLVRFVERGGAVLLATDQPLYAVGKDGEKGPTPGSEAVRELTGCITGNYSVITRANGYHDIPECPILHPLDPGDGPLLFYPPVVGKVQKEALHVATNVPTYLRDVGHQRAGVTRHFLAEFPRRCVYGRLGFLGEDKKPPPFAVSSEYGKGKMLFLADHSVFINAMMLPADLGNIDFAYNAIEWLKAGESTRDRCLFIEEGHIRTLFNIPIREVGLRPYHAQMVMTHNANKRIEEIENGRGFSAMLIDRIGANHYYLALLLGGTLALLGFGGYRLMLSRQRAHPQVPLLDQALAPPMAMLEQRQQALLLDNNLAEYARTLARQTLTPLLPAGVKPTATPPPLLLGRAGWWQRQRLRRTFAWLWRLAFAARPGRVSKRQFRRVLALVQHVQEAASAGRLQISEPTSKKPNPLTRRTRRVHPDPA